MSLKNFLTLTVAFGALACVCFYQYRDWFRRAHIQIAHTFRPLGLARAPKPGAPPDAVPLNSVMFRLDHAYALTSIKIVPVPELTTNKYAQAVWELTSDSNSPPLQAFAYGLGIKGMRVTAKGAKPVPLTTNISYRLFVQAGSIKGEHDFTITEDDHVVE